MFSLAMPRSTRSPASAHTSNCRSWAGAPRPVSGKEAARDPGRAGRWTRWPDGLEHAAIVGLNETGAATTVSPPVAGRRDPPPWRPAGAR